VASQEKQTTTVVTLRRGRLPIVLAGFAVVVLGSFALLAFSFLGGFTSINQDDPDVVVRNFIQAAAVDHDVARTQSYVCSSWAPADAIQALTVTQDPSVITTWRILSTNVNGNNAEVIVRITSVVGQFNDVQTWRFELVHTNTWHVCSGVSDPSLAPK
jgi:hypothetical protein